MRFFAFLILFVGTTNVFANSKMKPMELHAFNSRVARLLDFNNPANYKKISKNLSPKDKAVFQRLLVSKKGQKVKIYPFMSFLYIKDSKTQTAIEVVSLKPLKIRVDGGAAKTIDLKNIRGSFPNWKDGRVSLWDWMMPEAHAFCIWNCDTGTSASDWELLYGYAASSDIYAGDQPMVTDTDSRIVAAETASFVNDFGISKITCNPSKWAGYKTDTKNYVEVTRKDGGRTVLECDAFANNCRTFPIDDRGEILNTAAAKSSIDHKIVASVLPQLSEQLGGMSINPNALDVLCSEEECHLVASKNGGYSVSEGALSKLAEINLADVGDRSTRNQTEELLTKYRDMDKVEKMHYSDNGEIYPPENRGKAMYSMMACCGSSECVKYVNGAGRVQYEDQQKGVSQ